MNPTEAYRAEQRRVAWRRYARDVERARIEYEKDMEFWDVATIYPEKKLAHWDWHKPTAKELAQPRRIQ